MDGFVHKNVGIGGNLSVNKWIKQLEPGFLPQQIMSLEETGRDVANAHIWIFASKKKCSGVKWKKKMVQFCHWSGRGSFADLFTISSDMYVCVYEFIFLSVYILFSSCCVLGSQCLN